MSPLGLGLNSPAVVIGRQESWGPVDAQMEKDQLQSEAKGLGIPGACWATTKFKG